MKFSTKKLVLIAGIALTTLLLSWNRFNMIKIAPFYANKIAAHQWGNGDEMTDNDLLSLSANYDELTSPASNGKYMPVAEDVLVQRIPGDNNHLLMMSFYSKENYSEPLVTIEDDNTKLVFRDDGRGDDKKAGDGLYTAKIYADVNEFRKQSISNALAMKDAGPQYRFVNRSMTIDPDQTEGFDVKNFDTYHSVSIMTLKTQSSNKLIDSLRKNSVFITALSVIEDSTRTWNPCTQKGNVDGPWTFKTIMKQLATRRPDSVANDLQLSKFVKAWLNRFASDTIINSDTVKARPLVLTKILNPWLAKSQAGGAPAGQLDMKYAPFKLTAILNRFDLRERFLGIPAGESRFTFCLIDSNCTTTENFTCVVEYSIPKSNNCDTLHAWAQRWYDLKNYTLGSEAYNAALESITNTYTRSGSSPNKTNQSSLSTVRTNDRALSPNPVICEFREFRFNSSGTTLNETTVSKVPANYYNAQVDNAAVRRLVDFINVNRKGINKDQYDVPVIYLDSPMQGGKTQILGPTVGDPSSINVFHWDGTKVPNTPTYIKNSTTRQVFSLNTCSGCHSGEMQTNYTHVDPVFFGTEATLSGFLNGKAGQGGAIDFDNNPDNDSFIVKDPALRPPSNPQLRFVNEILRRAKDLKDYVVSPCLTPLAIRDQLTFSPLHAVH